jgi:uncharacterized protein (DUF1501 family)
MDIMAVLTTGMAGQVALAIGTVGRVAQAVGTADRIVQTDQNVRIGPTDPIVPTGRRGQPGQIAITLEAGAVIGTMALRT